MGKVSIAALPNATPPASRSTMGKNLRLYKNADCNCQWLCGGFFRHAQDGNQVKDARVCIHSGIDHLLFDLLLSRNMIPECHPKIFERYLQDQSQGKPCFGTDLQQRMELHILGHI